MYFSLFQAQFYSFFLDGTIFENIPTTRFYIEVRGKTRDIGHRNKKPVLYKNMGKNDCPAVPARIRVPSGYPAMVFSRKIRS